MTDNEIIKAYELCFAERGTSYTCAVCPYHQFGELCKVNRDKDALDLINRQKAEIERLQQSLDATIAGQESLQKYISKVKAEAIKEFAERLKDILAVEVTVEYEIADGFFKDFFDITETFDEIDNLVKEVVGEDK